MNDPRFEVYPREPADEPDYPRRSPGWGWRFVDANGRRTFIGGEGFGSVYDANRALYGACMDVLRMLLGPSIGLNPAGLRVRLIDEGGKHVDTLLREDRAGHVYAEVVGDD